MDLLTTALVGIGLSMDCFAVSLALGSTIKTRLLYAAVTVALCFCAFQAGMTLFVISFSGVMVGEYLETVLGDKMEVLGGVILILIGIKILCEHMIG